MEHLGADLMAWGLVMINTGKPVAAPLEKFSTSFLRDIYDKIQGTYPATQLPMRPRSGAENSAEAIKGKLKKIVADYIEIETDEDSNMENPNPDDNQPNPINQGELSKLMAFLQDQEVRLTAKMDEQEKRVTGRIEVTDKNVRAEIARMNAILVEEDNANPSKKHKPAGKGNKSKPDLTNTSGDDDDDEDAETKGTGDGRNSKSLLLPSKKRRSSLRGRPPWLK